MKRQSVAPEEFKPKVYKLRDREAIGRIYDAVNHEKQLVLANGGERVLVEDVHAKLIKEGYRVLYGQDNQVERVKQENKV
jgi:hypothetical protein